MAINVAAASHVRTRPEAEALSDGTFSLPGLLVLIIGARNKRRFLGYQPA